MRPHYGSSFPLQQNSTPSPSQPPQPGMKNPQIPIPFNNNNNNNNYMNMSNQPGPNNPQMGMPQFGPQNGNPNMGYGPQGGFPVRPPGFSNPPQYNQFCGNQFGQFNPMPMQIPMQMSMPMPMPMQMQMPGFPQFVPVNNGYQAHTPPQFGNFPYNPMPQPMINQSRPMNLPVMAPHGNSGPAGKGTGPVQSEESGKSFGQQNNWKNSPNKNFANNSRRGPQQGRFQNSQSNNHKKKGWKNFGSPNSQNGKGKTHGGNFGNDNSMVQGSEQKQRRSLALAYSEQEVKQWREERKKNYPSRDNVEKKLNKKMLDQESLQKEAVLRRERLKEILAKQAELGVEVAEIPGCFISDQKGQGHETGDNDRPFNKKGKFRNKFNKRGRYDKTDRYPKKQRQNHSNSSSNAQPVIAKKPPTFLEKLLRSDIKRDKSHLLQAFRFIVANSFFDDDSANRQLKFPSVVVSDGSVDNGTAKEICSNLNKDVSEISNTIFTGKVGEDSGNESGSDTREDDREEDGEIN